VGDARLILSAKVFARLAYSLGDRAQLLGHVAHARADIGLGLFANLRNRALGLFLHDRGRFGDLVPGLPGHFLGLVDGRLGRGAIHLIISMVRHVHTPFE